MTATPQIETTFREEYGRILAALISQLGDFMLAEDGLQEALVNALERWDKEGIPRNPGAWLMAVSKRRAIHRLRRAATQDHIALMLEPPQEKEPDDKELDMEDTIPVQRLKMM